MTEMIVGPALAVPSSTPAQPVVFDADGDMRVDMLALPVGQSSPSSIRLWRNAFDAVNGTGQVFDVYVSPSRVEYHPHLKQFLLVLQCGSAF